MSKHHNEPQSGRRRIEFRALLILAVGILALGSVSGGRAKPAAKPAPEQRKNYGIFSDQSQLHLEHARSRHERASRAQEDPVLRSEKQP